MSCRARTANAGLVMAALLSLAHPSFSQQPQCYGTLRAYALSHPSLKCTCPTPTSIPVCNTGGASAAPSAGWTPYITIPSYSPPKPLTPPSIPDQGSSIESARDQARKDMEQAQATTVRERESVVRILKGVTSGAGTTLKSGVPPITAPTPARTACGEGPLESTSLTAAREERLARKLGDARDRLQHINEALRKLIAANVAQRAEIDKLAAEISAQYEESLKRVGDVVIELLSNVSSGAFEEVQAKRIKEFKDAISGKIALKSTPLDATALQKVEREIQLLQSGQFRYMEATSVAQRVIDYSSLGMSAIDINDWRKEEQDNRALSGLALAGDLVIGLPTVVDWLEKKAFFYGDRVWQVKAMGTMAYHAWGFFLDILTQRAIWEPMTNNLQDHLKNNIQALDYLRQESARTSQEIRCLEKILR